MSVRKNASNPVVQALRCRVRFQTREPVARSTPPERPRRGNSDALDPLITSNKRSPGYIGRVAAVAALATGLTAVTAFLSLRLAKQIGRLSVPPLYDDVSYFVDAAKWLDAV